jgi:hypothetical protein
MALITKSSDAGLEGNAGVQVTPITAQAGVEIAAGDSLYLDSNGKLQKAVRPTVLISGSFGLVVKFAGLAARNIASGTYGEVYGRSSEFFYADSGLTPGSAIFPSATAGGLDDSAVAAPDQPVAIAVSATNIRLIAGV